MPSATTAAAPQCRRRRRRGQVVEVFGGRHGHDAAQHAGPEHFDETFVVAEKQDHRVAGHQAPALQGAERCDRALPKLPEAQHTLIVFAVDKGDLAIFARIGAKDRIERFETCHGCALGGRDTRRWTTPETRTD
jgi:hypothetical protein